MNYPKNESVIALAKILKILATMNSKDKNPYPPKKWQEKPAFWASELIKEAKRACRMSDDAERAITALFAEIDDEHFNEIPSLEQQAEFMRAFMSYKYKEINNANN